MEYRFGEDQAPAQTMEIRPSSDRFANPNGNNRAYELVQSSQQPSASTAQGTTGQSSSSPLPGPLQRLKENPGNLFFGDRGASNSTPGSAPPRFSDQAPGQGTAPRPSLLNLGRFFSSSQDATAQSRTSGFLARIDQLKQNPNNLLFEPFMRGEYFSNVNLNVITANEGGNLLTGYFPGDPRKHPNAGVTIGKGVDLNQNSPDDLRRMGVPESLIQKFMPYFGLAGRKAADKLNDDAARHSTLSLTPKEADQLNRAVMTSNFNAAGKAFNNASPNANFIDLPWQAQTAIADLWYNRGNLTAADPKFWGQVTSGDWKSAVGHLQTLNTGNESLKRRAKTDAELLKQAVDAGTLP